LLLWAVESHEKYMAARFNGDSRVMHYSFYLLAKDRLNLNLD
jgi:hypothetical protein